MNGRRLFFAGTIALLTLATSGPLWADGARLYAENCVACHQADGSGTEGLAPPLAGKLVKRAQSAVGREYLAQVLVSGMVGIITSHGVSYIGNMPAAPLSDEELAQVLGYVLTTYNKVSPPLPVELFAAARGRAMTPSAVYKQRKSVLAEVGE